MELIQEFKNYLLSQKNVASKATVKNYLADVRKFISWFETKYQQIFSPSSITREIIQDFRLSKATDLSASSIDRHLSSLKKFFSFLKLEGKIAHSPFEQVTPSAEALAKVDPWHVKEFKDFLYVYNASRLTIKNYLIDVKQFFTWVEEVAITKDSYLVGKNLLHELNDGLIQEYSQRLLEHGQLSPNSINRKLSSLRKYINWAASQGLLADNMTSVPANISSVLPNEAGELMENKNEIASSSAKGETPRNDDSLDEDTFEIISAGQIPNTRYSPFPPFRLFQKIAKGLSLGLDYLVIVPTAYLAGEAKHAIWMLKGKPLFVRGISNIPFGFAHGKQAILKSKVSNIKKSLYNPLAISITHYPWYKKLVFHAQYTRPKWYRRYHNLAIARYFNWAILIIFCAMIGFGLYSTFFSNARKSPTLATGPVAPPRILSFQGRLTDNSDNPITTNTNLRFAIYSDKTASGGALLWQETDYVSPDTDGDFSTLLGNATTIPQSLFAQNNALWLGVSVEQTAELTPRQQLATVAFATNAEVLQGLPPLVQGASGSQANANTVLVLDSAGNLDLGQISTTIQSSSGQFTLSGKTLVLQTAASSNGNITLAPDGLGKIELQKPLQNSTLNNNVTTAAGAVEVDDLFAILATSSGQSAFTLNQNGAGPLISASASGVAKFTVDNSGNTTIAGNLSLLGTVTTTLTPSVAQTDTLNLGTSGSQEWNNLYVKNIFTSGTQLIQYWQRNLGVLSSANITDDLAVGGISTASAKFQIFGLTGNATTSGNLIFAGSAGSNLIAAQNKAGLTIGDGNTGNIILNGGNVGIGSTNPIQKLDVNGNIQAGEFLDQQNPSYFLDPAATGTSLVTAGNVGIGTTSPVVTLDVRGNSGTLGVASASGKTSFAVLVTNNDGVGDLFTASASSQARFTIANDGTLRNSLLPNITNTYDLGSTTLQWRNIYGQNIYSNGVLLSGNLWQRNFGALSPTNITDDLLIGGTSTSSARFAVINAVGPGTPTASLSAGLNTGFSLDSSGNIVTYAAQSLTLGGTKTGNINLGTDATARLITIGNTTGASGITERLGTGNYSLDGVGGSTYSIGPSTVGGTITIGGTAGTGIITLGSSSTTQTTIIGGGSGVSTVQIAGGSAANVVQIANTQTGGSVSIGTAMTGGTITLGGAVAQTGAITIGQSTATNTIAIGSGVTASGNTQTINIGNGAGAGTALNVNILSGSGTAGTAALSLGNNQQVNVIDIGNVAEAANRTTTIDGGNSAQNDTLNIMAGAPSASTQTVNILTGNATGGTQAVNIGTGTRANTITLGGAAASTINIGTTLTGGTLALGSSSDTTTIKGTNFTAGGVAYATSNTLNFVTGSSGQCLLSNGATAPSFGLCTFGNGNYWDLQQGALYPFNPTVDLLIGTLTPGATTSAKFAVSGIAGSLTPSASVSATTASGGTGTGLYIKGDGSLQSVINGTLTIGGGTTGNIVLKPLNGAAGGTLTVSGLATGVVHSASGLISSSNVDLVNDITNTLTVGHGGTGQTSFNANALIFGSGGSSALGSLAIGNNNDMLAIVGGSLVWSPYATHSALFVNNNAQLNTVSSSTNTIDPTTNGTLNLGDGSHYFGTIYATNVVVPIGNGTSGFWQLSNNVISPINNLYDLAIGGSATGSATPWQVFGTTVGAFNTAGTATTSGNLAFRGSTTEIDLLNGTGLNIKSSVGGNSGLTSVLNLTNSGNMTLAGTLAVNGNAITTTSSTTFNLLDSTIATMNFAQNVTTFAIGQLGTVTTFQGAFTLGDSTHTIAINDKLSADLLTNADNTYNLGAAGNNFSNIYGHNFFVPATSGTTAGLWQVTTNTISPTYNWQDLAIGGTATASSKFQVFASQYANDFGTILAGTASSSGGLTFKGGATNIDLLSNSTLSFFNSVGGDKGITATNPELFLGSNGRISMGTTNPIATLDIRGASSTVAVASISGQTSATGFVISNNGTGNYLDINNGGLNIASFIQNGSLGHNAFVPGATDSYDLGSNPVSGGREWDTLYVRQVISPSTGGIAGFWQLTAGVLAPSNLTNDLVIGGASTASAKFQVLGSTANAGDTTITTSTVTGNPLSILANSLTTSTVATFSATSLTSGNFLTLLAPNPSNNFTGNIINASSPNHTYMTLTNQDLTIGGHKNFKSISNVQKVVVYDTSKDSDGGRWTNDERAAASSWYNETLNTSSRGLTHAFPRKAIIVITNGSNASDTMDIYDAKDNSLWMQFNKGIAATSNMVGPTTSSVASSAAALNGKIYLANSGVSGGVYVIDFKADSSYKYDSAGYYTGVNSISSRNSTDTYKSVPSVFTQLVSSNVNDVAVNLINGSTYLAVATKPTTTTGDITFINESNESVVANYGPNSANANAAYVALTSVGDLYALISDPANVTPVNYALKVKHNAQNGSGNAAVFSEIYTNASGDLTHYGAVSPDVNGNFSTLTYTPGPASTSATFIPTALFVTQGTSNIDGKSNTIYMDAQGNGGSLMVMQENQASPSAGSIKYYNASDISEQMVGDIRVMLPMAGSGTLTTNTTLTGADKDVSVKGINFTTKTATVTHTASAGTNGVRGTGLTFNGTSDYICTGTAGTCANNDMLNSAKTNLSMSFWIKTSSTSRVLVNKQATPASAFPPSAAQAGTAGYDIQITSNGNLNTIITDGGSGTSNSDILVSSRTINDSNWHHIAVTFSRPSETVDCNTSSNICTLNQYIDGQLDGTGTNAMATITNTNFLTLMANSAATAANFTSGTMDEFMITHTVLTGSEIAALYQNGLRASQNHSTPTIRGVVYGADTQQKLQGGISNVTAVAASMQNGQIYVGNSLGGVSVVGMDSDTVTDAYTNAITTLDDQNLSWAGNNNVAINSISLGQSYGNGMLLAFGSNNAGTGSVWMESQDTTLKDFFVTNYDPFGGTLTQSNLNVDTLLRVTNQLSTRLDNMAFPATASAALVDAFRVDSNGNFLSRSLFNSASAMQFQNAAGTTLLSIDTTGNASGSLLNINQPGTGNLIVASSAAGTQFKVDNNGIITASQFLDMQNTAYFLDPAATGTSLTTAGNVGIGTTAPTNSLQVVGDLQVGKDATVWGVSGYLQRRQVSITNNSGSALTNYQVKVIVDTATLITAGKITSSACNDIRFTDTDGTTNLNYWIENGCNTNYTTIWVKVPTIGYPNKTIYMYYGKNGDSAGTYPTGSNPFIREITGVQAAYRLDEPTYDPIVDYSTNGNVATGSGTTVVTGKFGNARSFNGTSDYISASDSASLRITQPLSVGIWFKTTTTPGATEVMIRKDATSGTRLLYGLSFLTSNKVEAAYVNGATVTTVDSTASTYNDGIWHYAVMTLTGGTLTLYVDGISTGTPATSITVGAAPNGEFDIGAAPPFLSTARNNYFAGSLDEARVYNIALSTAQITDLYGSGGSNYGYVSTNNATKEELTAYTAIAPTTYLNPEQSTLQSIPSFYVQNTTGAVALGTLSIASTSARLTVAGDIKSGLYDTTAWGAGFAGYSYRARVAADNTKASTDLTNYIVQVTTSTAAPIANGKMRSDCGDIRFADADGNTSLSYWIEPGTCNTATTSANIKIPTIPGSASKNIYMYYGNPAVTTTSSTGIFSQNLSSLQAAWRFDETSGSSATDYSGNNNTGTATGTTIVGGYANNARYFNGSTDVVNVPDNAALNATTATWTLWVKTTLPVNTGNPAAIMTKANSVSSTNGVIIRQDTNGIADCNVKGSSSNAETEAGPSISDGKWHFIACVIVGGGGANTSILYIDGVNVGTFQAPSFTMDPSALRFAKSNDVSGWSVYSGSIDEPRIYNAALTSGQISTLYGSRTGYSYVTTNSAFNDYERQFNNPEPATTVDTEQDPSQVDPTLYVNNTFNFVGIDTANPVAPLEVVGTSANSNYRGLRISGGPAARLTLVSSDNSTNLWNLDDNSGTLRIYRENFNAAGSGSGGVVAMAIQNNGNIGIGTTSPGLSLDVHNSNQGYPVAIGGGAQTAGVARFGTAQNIYLDVGTANASPWGAWIQVHNISNDSAFPLLLQPNGGNVGIGTTSPDFTVQMSTNSTSATYLSLTNTSTNGREYLLGSTGTSNAQGAGNFVIWDNTAGANRFTLDSGGNVGIGTTLPLEPLTVGTTTSNAIHLGTTDPATGAWIRNDGSNTVFATKIGSLYIGYNGASNPINFIPGGTTTKMQLTSGGNLGIGTTTVGNLLELHGDGTFTAGMRISNSGVTWQIGNGVQSTSDGRFGIFDVGGANRLVIDTVGNVGIATTGPGAKFVVNANCANPGGGNLSCTDYAEYYNASEIVSPADIVSLDEASSSGKLVKLARKSYDQKIIGVASTYPAISIQEDQIMFSDRGTDTMVKPSLKPPVALAGRVPVKITTINGPIHIGDPITSSDIAGFGMKATHAGTIIGKAMQEFNPNNGNNGQGILDCPSNIAHDIYCGKVYIYTNTSWYDPDVYLTSTGDINISPATPSADFSTPHYYTLSDALGNPVSRMGSFLELVVGNLRAGGISAQEIATNSLAIATDNISIAGQSLHDYISGIVTEVLNTKYHIQNTGTVSPIAEVNELHTNLISPLASNSAIALGFDNSGININNTISQQTVARIDNSGNASFSGQLSSRSLAVNGDATIAGTLHADKIEANSIAGLQAVVGTLSAQNITNVTNIYFATSSGSHTGENNPTGSNTSGNNSGGLLTSSGGIATSPSAPRNDIGYINIASFSAYFAYVPNLKAMTAEFDQGLIAFGPTSLSDTSISGTLNVGSQLSIADTSINVLGSDLQLQPLRQGGIAFEGGLLAIDTDGNLTVNGNATIKGALAVDTIFPLPGKDVNVILPSCDPQSNTCHSRVGGNPGGGSPIGVGDDNGSHLNIQNASGSSVLSFNQFGDLIASGEATINKLNFNVVRPALAISSTEIIATSSAGTAQIGAHQSQLTIDNSHVTSNSLIYITPVGQNTVTPYLLRQKAGTSFTVGIQSPQLTPVPFNWLIVN